MADDGSLSPSISRFANNVSKLISSHALRKRVSGSSNQHSRDFSTSFDERIVDELNRSKNRCYVARNTIDNRRRTNGHRHSSRALTV